MGLSALRSGPHATPLVISVTLGGPVYPLLGSAADDMVTGKGEPNGLWEHGGCCLGNRCIGCTVTYMMSQVSRSRYQHPPSTWGP